MENWLCRLAVALMSLGPAATFGSAMCAGPLTFLAPGPGTPLPENPRLFLFVPERAEVPRVRVWTESGEPRFEIAPISAAPAFTVYRIDVWAEAGARLTIRLESPDRAARGLDHEYTVTRSVPTPREPPSVTGIEPDVYTWTCSFQKTQNVYVSSADRPAPAYRIDWADDEAAFTSGRRQSVVIPADMMGFFRYGFEHEELEPRAVLQLGFVSCLGPTFEWKPGTPVHLAIVALNADRSESAVTSADPWLTVSPPERRLTQILIDDYWVPIQYRVLYWVRFVP